MALPAVNSLHLMALMELFSKAERSFSLIR
nr:MAG TPA: hypothetical protein [Caudoviricetes sp.]